MCKRNKPAIARIIFESIPDYTERREHAQNALYEDAIYSFPEFVDMLIHHGAIAHLCNDTGVYPLLCAAHNGNVESITSLLRSGADVKCHTDGETAMHYAALYGNTDAVRYFVENGLSPGDKNKDGNTPLIYAIRNGNLECVEFLANFSCSFDSDDQSALHAACYFGDLAITKCIHENTCRDIDEKNATKDTPLCIACQKGHAKIVEFLIKEGADINLCGRKSLTPLHYAVLDGGIGIHGQIDVNILDIVLLLTRAGANKTLKDSKGNIPYYYAQHKVLYRLLSLNGYY